MFIVTLLRKPLPKGSTVAANSITHGTGGIDVDRCRIETSEMSKRVHKPGVVYDGCHEGYERPGRSKYTPKTDWEMEVGGRWPANLILADGVTVAMMDEQSGIQKSGVAVQRNRDGGPRGWIAVGGHTKNPTEDLGYDDAGGASRFFKQVSSD